MLCTTFTLYSESKWEQMLSSSKKILHLNLSKSQKRDLRDTFSVTHDITCVFGWTVALIVYSRSMTTFANLSVCSSPSLSLVHVLCSWSVSALPITMVMKIRRSSCVLFLRNCTTNHIAATHSPVRKQR